MKQLLFLLLFPCLAMAQYQGNAGQKITLGEQTSADGLVWRGVANLDTVAATSKITRANKLDTSAYLLLDTVTNLLWHYKIGSNAWTQAGGSTLDTATMLLPYWRSGRFSGVLPVANGGTNRITMPAGYVLHGDGTSVDTAIGLFWDRTNRLLGIGTNAPSALLTMTGYNDSRQGIRLNNVNNVSSAFVVFNSTTATGTTTNALISGHQTSSTLSQPCLLFRQDGTADILQLLGSSAVPRLSVASGGAVKINGLAGINDIGADANGVLQAATSDMNLKNTIENSPFGLNEILLLNPVTFLYNDENRKIDSDIKEVGFIAQDVFDIIPNAVSSTGTGDLQLDYRAITAALVKAIQEQQTLIKALEQRILNLENK